MSAYIKVDCARFTDEPNMTALRSSGLAKHGAAGLFPKVPYPFSC